MALSFCNLLTGKILSFPCIIPSQKKIPLNDILFLSFMFISTLHHNMWHVDGFFTVGSRQLTVTLPPTHHPKPHTPHLYAYNDYLELACQNKGFRN